DKEVSSKIAAQVASYAERFETEDPSELIAIAFQLCLFFAVSDEEAKNTFTLLQPVLQSYLCTPDALHELVRLIVEVQLPFKAVSSLLQITAHVHTEGTYSGYNALQFGNHTLFFSDMLYTAIPRASGCNCDSMIPLYQMLLPTLPASKTDQAYARELHAPLFTLLKSQSRLVSSVGFSLLRTFSLTHETLAAAYRVSLPQHLASRLYTEYSIDPAFTMLADAISQNEEEMATHLFHILLSRYSVGEIAARTPQTKETLYPLLVSIAPTHIEALHYLVDKKLTEEAELELVEHWPKLVERDTFYDECIKETQIGVHLLKKGASAGVIKEVVSLKSRSLDSFYYLITHKKFAALFADDPEYLSRTYVSYIGCEANSLDRRLVVAKMAFRAAFQADVAAIYVQLAHAIGPLVQSLSFDAWPLVEKLVQLEIQREAVELLESCNSLSSSHAEELLLWCEGLVIREQYEHLERVFVFCRTNAPIFPERYLRIVLALAKREPTEERLAEIAECNVKNSPELFLEVLAFATTVMPNRLLMHLLDQLVYLKPQIAHCSTLTNAVHTACSHFSDVEACTKLLEIVLTCLPDDTPERSREALALLDTLTPKVSPIRSCVLLIQHPNAAFKARACATLIEVIKTTSRQEDIPQIDYSPFFAVDEWRENIMQSLEAQILFRAIYYRLLFKWLEQSPTATIFTRVTKLLRSVLERKKQVDPQALVHAKECLKLFFAWSPAFGNPLLLEQCKMLKWISSRITQKQSILEEYIAPKLLEKITCSILDCGLDPQALAYPNALGDFLIACEKERIFEADFTIYCQLYLFIYGVLPSGDNRSMSESRTLSSEKGAVTFQLLQRLAAKPPLLRRFAQILQSHYAHLNKNDITKCCTLAKATVKDMRTKWAAQAEILAIIDTIPHEPTRASIRKQLEQKL
ncbi:MAG: hypothetical protein JSS12_08100, partial [Verrucomicrobia bacterium]|nr:hypothetical protein [Verrucomicrobiota bacterium]